MRVWEYVSMRVWVWVRESTIFSYIPLHSYFHTLKPEIPQFEIRNIRILIGCFYSFRNKFSGFQRIYNIINP